DHRTITAASAAAVCGVVAGFPFDTIKTRMQTHNYNSLIDCARITYRDEGIRGYFRGMIPPLITVSLVKSISFSTYENIKQTVIRAPWCPIDSTHLPSYSLLCFLAGAASGGFLAFLSCPFELVKVQKQLEQLLSARPATLGNTSSWQAAKDLYALRGVRGLYQGLFSHMLRDSLGTGIYFCTYETIKRLMSSPESPPGPLTFFLSGGICGVFSWLIIFPIDLVKSTIQKDALLPSHLVRYRGFLDCFTDLYRQRGIVSLYRGISVTLIRAFPIHSLNFLVYEGVLSMIRKHAPEKSA
ncbi:mitochondrial carrier domain-containing protein, partial [Dimargaris cristalligena]